MPYDLREERGNAIVNKHIKIIQDLVNQIEENVSYDVNIKSLSQSYSLSPWHFQRLFKSIVGSSLGQYTRGRRLSIAANMLVETDSSILDIAVNVGFSTHESFTRSFKDYFNYSPKDFRIEKPKVLINKKPLLTDELLEHITTGINLEPKIVELPEQLIVGMETKIPSPFVSRNKICDYVATFWYSLFEQERKVKNKIAHTYYALSISKSGDFTEEELTYIAGVPVSLVENIPKEMKVYTLPKRKVAIFDIKTNIDAETAQKTADYIYGYWIPNSKYKRGIGADYELFQNAVDFTKGDFDTSYVIPISN